jgi:metal-dependent hydrolase (beta-lactamase superfamily II)
LEYCTPDFVPDDSAVAILIEQGLFVITGCGHAGIVNTLEQARQSRNCDSEDIVQLNKETVSRKRRFRG